MENAALRCGSKVTLSIMDKSISLGCQDHEFPSASKKWQSHTDGSWVMYHVAALCCPPSPSSQIDAGNLHTNKTTAAARGLQQESSSGMDVYTASNQMTWNCYSWTSSQEAYFAGPGGYSNATQAMVRSYDK